jgi:hypothetical protein
LDKKLKFSKTNREGTEIIKPIKLKMEEAVKMVLDSKITHAQTCVLILKADYYLKR